MPLRFTLSEHAKFRVQQGLFDPESARKVINKPHSVKSQSNGKIKATGQSSDGRTLTIIYKEISKNKVLIITGYHED